MTDFCIKRQFAYHKKFAFCKNSVYITEYETRNGISGLPPLPAGCLFCTQGAFCVFLARIRAPRGLCVPGLPEARVRRQKQPERNRRRTRRERGRPFGFRALLFPRPRPFQSGEGCRRKKVRVRRYALHRESEQSERGGRGPVRLLQFLA